MTLPLGVATENGPGSSDAVGWSPRSRIAFRFVFCYFLLHILPFPLTWIGFPNRWYLQGWLYTVQFVNHAILRRAHDIPVYVNGSGDNTWRYAMALGMLVLAIIATIVWSFADRKRPDYDSLHGWFRVLLRLWLAESMASYGAQKLFAAQYPPPFLGQYLTTYGDSSPMGLLWTFMQSSQPYTKFAGATEMLGAILLIIPRLTTLGALVSFAAMANVFALNLSFDVPVKIRSFHMLTAALVLAAPDARRLLEFFVKRNPVALRKDVRLSHAWADRLAVGFQLAFGACMVLVLMINAHRGAESLATTRQWPLAGYWRVDEFVLDGVPHPPLVTDALRWQRLAFDAPQFASLQMIDGQVIACRTTFDPIRRRLDVTAMDGPRFSIRPPHWTDHFTYAQPEADTLLVTGTHQGKPLALTLHRESRQFLLKTRGFHWINEFPFNQ